MEECSERDMACGGSRACRAEEYITLIECEDMQRLGRQSDLMPVLLYCCFGQSSRSGGVPAFFSGYKWVFG